MSVRNSRTLISLERETRYSLPALTVELSPSSIASINFAKAAALRTAELADVALDAYVCTQLAYFVVTGARDEIRTRDICLGKATLYH